MDTSHNCTVTYAQKLEGTPGAHSDSNVQSELQRKQGALEIGGGVGQGPLWGQLVFIKDK